MSHDNKPHDQLLHDQQQYSQQQYDQPQVKLSGVHQERLAIFLPRWIGDVVMATPALRALRQHLPPTVHITGIVKPYVREVLDGTDWLDDYLVHDVRSSHADERGWRFVRELRQRRFDTVALFTNSTRTGLLAWLSGAPRRIGYGRWGGKLLLTERIRFPRENGRIEPHSAVDTYARVTERLGVTIRDKAVCVRTTLAEQRQAMAAFKALGIQPQRPVIALNTGGAYGVAKRWPDEHFGQLAKMICQHLHAQVLVLCGPQEKAAALNIARLAGHPDVYTLAEQPMSIGLTKGCLERSWLMVTTDSGPRHLAAALGVSTVTIFGPTDPRWSRNYAPRSSEVWHEVPCGPCGRRTCPLGHHQCMRDLTPATVFAAVEQQWQQLPWFRAA